MVDVNTLKRAVQQYKFHSRPSSANQSTVATVGDINRLIDQTAKLMDQFVAELERNN